MANNNFKINVNTDEMKVILEEYKKQKNSLDQLFNNFPKHCCLSSE